MRFTAILFGINQKNMYDILELSKKLLPELRDIAKELDIKKVESFKKQDLIYKILDTQAINASTNPKPPKRRLNQSKKFRKKKPNRLRKNQNLKRKS